MRFIIQYTPNRQNFLETITEAEGEIVGAHFEYLKSILEKGNLDFAGRRKDAVFGIAIFKAESYNQARSLVENDPVVKAKVFSATLGEFEFALSAHKI